MRRMAGGEGEAEEGYKEVKAADAAKAKTRKERKEAERAAKTSESVNLPAGAPQHNTSSHHPIEQKSSCERVACDRIVDLTRYVDRLCCRCG